MIYLLSDGMIAGGAGVRLRYVYLSY